ncbi:hypothetical protein ACFE04_026305 [Oxalis oulophora]
MAFVFDHLPDDILVEIFLRLSYKEIRRCLLVCLRWRKICSEFSVISHFASFRSSNRIYPPFAFLYQIDIRGVVPFDHHLYTNTHKTGHFLSLDFLPINMSGNIYVLQSSNDLLLCSADLDHHDVYYICNPLSKQWVSLPPTPSPQRQAKVAFYCDISYDKYKYESRGTSFWVINRFKYFVLRYIVRSTMELALFSSENGVWRTFLEPKPYEFFDPNLWVTCSVIYNGMIWPMHNHKHIDVYDLHHTNDNQCPQQRWHMVDMPSDVYTASRSYVGVSNGHLRLSQIFTYKDKIINNMQDPAVINLEPCLRIWELNYSEEWSLVHNVYLKDLGDEFNHLSESMDLCFYNIYQIYFHPVEVDNIFIKLRSPEGYFEYNVRHRAMKFQAVEYIKGRNRVRQHFPFMLPNYPTPISNM